MHGSGTSYAAAASLLDELMAFAQSTESIPELSWRPLSTIFGHLDPDVVSLQLMRDLAPVEITLLARWFEGTTPEDAERYLDQALEDLERRMEDPMATSVEIPQAIYDDFEPGQVPADVRAERELADQRARDRENSQKRTEAKTIKADDETAFPGGLVPKDMPARRMQGKVRTRRR